MAYQGFDALKSKLAGKPGVNNAGALAASIGRKKYGESKMSQASSFGKADPNAAPMLKPGK